ncbi:MAG: hypothetical protein ACREIP_16010, partial [Alphaproteobacteria bacterium]
AEAPAEIGQGSVLDPREGNLQLPRSQALASIKGAFAGLSLGHPGGRETRENRVRPVSIENRHPTAPRRSATPGPCSKKKKARFLHMFEGTEIEPGCRNLIRLTQCVVL